MIDKLLQEHLLPAFFVIAGSGGFRQIAPFAVEFGLPDRLAVDKGHDPLLRGRRCAARQQEEGTADRDGHEPKEADAQTSGGIDQWSLHADVSPRLNQPSDAGVVLLLVSQTPRLCKVVVSSEKMEVQS